MFFSRQTVADTPASAAPCRRITVPFGNFQAGEVRRLINFAPEKASWIAQLLASSEPCTDPGDEFCRELDVQTYDPTVLDFNAPPRPNFSRADLRQMYHYDDHAINFAMDLHLLARPTATISRAAELQGGKVTDFSESWRASDVEKFDGIISRLCPTLPARDLR